MRIWYHHRWGNIKLKPVCFSIMVPDAYTGSLAFKEVVEMLMYVMQEKGIPCDLRNNEILPSHINVVFGAHMMDPFFIYQLPKDTVVFNTEKLSEDNGQLVDTVCGFAEAGLHLWDCSDANVTLLTRKISPGSLSRIVLGYHRLLDRIPAAEEPEIDLLVFGLIDPSHQPVMDQLISSGLNICHLPDIYGEKRDEYIAKSKAVLNLNYRDSELSEIVRICYLLCNGKQVIAEIEKGTVVNPDLLKSLVPCSRSDMSETAINLIRSGSWRLPNEIGREVMRQRDVWGSVENGLKKVLGRA